MTKGQTLCLTAHHFKRMFLPQELRGTSARELQAARRELEEESSRQRQHYLEEVELLKVRSEEKLQDKINQLMVKQAMILTNKMITVLIKFKLNFFYSTNKFCKKIKKQKVSSLRLFFTLLHIICIAVYTCNSGWALEALCNSSGLFVSAIALLKLQLYRSSDGSQSWILSHFCFIQTQFPIILLSYIQKCLRQYALNLCDCGLCCCI